MTLVGQKIPIGEGMSVGIALGSNLGDRLANLREARDRLIALCTAGAPFRQATIYQSEPVACPDGSPDFFNTVVEIHYEGDPENLLRETQKIEYDLGRPSERSLNAPRPIDIDLLYFGDRQLRNDRLELPHPRLALRRFVLQPLAEIRPDLVLPGDDATVAEHLHRLTSDEAPLRPVHHDW